MREEYGKREDGEGGTKVKAKEPHPSPGAWGIRVVDLTRRCALMTVKHEWVGEGRRRVAILIGKK